MKQKTPSSPITARTALKKQGDNNNNNNNKSLQSPSQPRLRASSKAPKSPPESSTRDKSVPPDLKDDSRAKRGAAVGSRKGREAEEAKVVVVSRPRRRLGDFGLRKSGDDDPDGKKRKELQDKLEVSDNLIKSLQSEVLALKEELDRVKSLNVELESQNTKLTRNLAAAEAKEATVGTGNSGKKEPIIGEHQSPKFKDIQKLIADKLELSRVKKEGTPEVNFAKASIPSPTRSFSIHETKSIGRKSPPNMCLQPPPPPPIIGRNSAPSTCQQPPPPPPPPPIPSRPSARLSNTQKGAAIVELFHSLKNKDGKIDSKGPVNHQRPVVISAHSSIVGEIQNRSAHLLAIRTDIETKGEFVNDLIKKVVDAAFTDIEEVLKFVNWLDGKLSSLADERAVLKHFKWPEKKADALREAAIEYHELKMLEQEISSYKDDPDIPCGAALKKMATLLDKSERRIQRLIMLRSSVIHSYQVYNIPTAWMLDSGIMSNIKQASMTLVKMYMKRVTIELESIRNSDRESIQDSLLLQGVHFAYRAHQFAGGLDSETMCCFEEIRQRVPGHLAGSRELLAGIP
ncbi:protein CHUP1, chloroplastic isoform X1 [Vigna unguiculata]|uniref:protein CHUP1, chloroplastic isoform X1 n=1 Tax=Vigna unguiculata TaxID=3917 RepID=UPI001016B1F2|nr:protein CHUP1, chloroplastic isoform X1 [Vigna unguiculata]XP_027919078.1 protein CHUP1, chloroplastic isoform X1 [Vigna unguiculata]XP_027919079.1 protein CHUP1, chloroplastic isoform X1 [Vigna unguiculata]